MRPKPIVIRARVVTRYPRFVHLNAVFIFILSNNEAAFFFVLLIQIPHNFKQPLCIFHQKRPLFFQFLSNLFLFINSRLFLLTLPFLIFLAFPLFLLPFLTYSILFFLDQRN